VRRTSLQRVSLSIAAFALLFMGADWTRFRGPDARGVSDATGVPATWTAEENVVWKTPLPGFGASSPITCGDKIFLTCYSGYGLSKDEPGEQDDLQHILLCFDQTDGKVVWAKATEAELPDTKYGGFIALHGYASSTPTTDGQAVYAFFGRSGVFAYRLDGRPLWRADVGDGTHNWGSATSPILFENLLIVSASVESESVVGLDKKTGEEVWRVPDVKSSWSTPLVVDLADGSHELVVSSHSKIRGIDPATGKVLWECAGVPDYVCPSVTAHDGVVYVTGGRKPFTFAIRAGGRGDVTDTHVLWELGETPKVPTPLYHDGHLYWVSQRGVAVCVDAKTGEVVYEERMDVSGRGDKVYASPVLVDGKLFCVTRSDGTIVLAPGPEFNEIARNDLGDDSIFNATPVPLDDDRLLLRSDRYLYCIGK